jgi:hypothetical protein
MGAVVLDAPDLPEALQIREAATVSTQPDASGHVAPTRWLGRSRARSHPHRRSLATAL